jgi:hypothetical protein
MKQTERESFEDAVKEWREKWQNFIDERTINPLTGKSFYTHKLDSGVPIGAWETTCLGYSHGMTI